METVDRLDDRQESKSRGPVLRGQNDGLAPAEAEALYRTLVEQIPAATYLWDVTGGVESPSLWVSSRLRDILGFEPEGWMADANQWFEHVHPQDRAAVIEETSRTVGSGEPFKMEYRMLAADGRVVWVHDEATVVGRDQHGRVTLHQGILLDITVQKEADEKERKAKHSLEQAVRRSSESEARKSAILESALDCVIAMDEQGRITEFNPAAERTFGCARADVVGKELADVIIPESLRARHRLGLRHFILTGRAEILNKRLETRAQRADGSEFPVELAVSRVNLPGPALFTGYVRDITERKRAELEIERALQAERAAAKRLRDLDNLKNTFLEAVSHDLRTPLAVVLGLALTLDRRDLELSQEERTDLTTRLASNARKLDRILSDLLDLERLVRGVVEPKAERVDVGNLARRMVAEADFLSGRSVSVEAANVVAEVDVAKMERIIENLLVNAGKHTPVECSIWVKVTRGKDGVLIVVEDDGPGVAPGLREQIFEPFQRGGGDHPSPGSGIGLSLVSRFAELHRGKAWVQERPGGGASFRVFLPFAQSRGPSARAS